MNMETNQTLEPAGLRISLISVLREDSIKHPDKLKEVNTIVLAEFDIAPIVRNPQGKLFMQLAGEYYPLTLGKWIQKEKVTFVEDPEEEEVEYNCMMEVKGIHYLFEIEPENPWVNLPDTNGNYIAKGDEKILKDCNNAIRNNKNYKFHPEILPEPFWGDIKNANVYILSGNPGLGDDEKDFNNNDTFKNATLYNISLDKPKIVWLDQECKKEIFNGKPHPGFEYWEKRTRVLREAIANLSNCHIEGVKLNICIIEYFPYHSKKISSKMKTEGPKLPSSKFVDYYIEKAIQEEKWIVIARCKNDWTHRINGHWMGCKLENYKNSGNVLITHSQQMYLTPRNLVNKDELKNYEKCPENAPTWRKFVEACTCKLKQ